MAKLLADSPNTGSPARSVTRVGTRTMLVPPCRVTSWAETDKTKPSVSETARLTMKRLKAFPHPVFTRQELISSDKWEIVPVTGRRPCSSRRRTLRHKAPEEAVALPLRALWIVRHLDGQPLHDVFELARGRKIHRLIQIIRGRMISLRQPLFLGDRLRGSRHKAHLHRQCRNSLPNEAVLIAADEGIPQRSIQLHSAGNSCTGDE